jgi:hypothetical protein
LAIPRIIYGHLLVQCQQPVKYRLHTALIISMMLPIRSNRKSEAKMS